MRKAYYINLAVALTLLAGILFLSARTEFRVLDSEKVFIFRFINSLYYLDQAKQQWAVTKNKSEVDVPTLEDLTPFLGDGGDGIRRLMALGIDYRITSTENPQSDVATLTHELRFRRGICLLYPAGTSFGLQARWTFPPESKVESFWTRWALNNLDYLLEIALGLLVVGNLLVLLIKKIWGLKNPNRRRVSP